MTYAKDTEVPADRSRAEIERTLQRYGADGFSVRVGGDPGRDPVQGPGSVHPVHCRASPREDFAFTPAKRQRRSDAAIQSAFEQAVRRRWRALALVIKAKLEAVESGITEFEAEFLAHIVLPDGTTVGDWVRPQVEQAYQLGTMPRMLPMPKEES